MSKKPLALAFRTAPQIIAQAPGPAAPFDPVSGPAYFQALVGGGVVYKIFVYNRTNSTRYFTVFDSATALSQGDPIAFPWKVEGRSNITIEFPTGAAFVDGVSCYLSRDSQVLEVNVADSMNVMLTGRINPEDFAGGNIEDELPDIEP